MSETSGPDANQRMGAPSQHAGVLTGLNGNELYCLDKLGFRPGNVAVGNSVYSLGFLGGLRTAGRGLVGGELNQVTEIIVEGRKLSLSRLHNEMQQHQAQGITGVTSELIAHAGNVEFLSVGSVLHNEHVQRPFTSSANGQELYCQVDAGYAPVEFVFGNVAYSMGIGRGILGALRSLGRGEVKEYSDIFNNTRTLALTRIENEARNVGANSVVGIETTILPFGVAQEMLMIGTASQTEYNSSPNVFTSHLTCEELWTVTSMGYVPLRLLLGTSVYSLGIVGGVKAMFKSFVKGEIRELTTMIYEARENSLGKLRDHAQAIGADDVLGIKTYVYDLGNGIIEFLAMGTAVQRVGGNVRTRSEQLPPQAIMRSKDTFVNAADLAFGVDLNNND